MLCAGDYWGYEPDFVDWRFNGKNSPIEVCSVVISVVVNSVIVNSLVVIPVT